MTSTNEGSAGEQKGVCLRALPELKNIPIIRKQPQPVLLIGSPIRAFVVNWRMLRIPQHVLQPRRARRSTLFRDPVVGDQDLKQFEFAARIPQFQFSPSQYITQESRNEKGHMMLVLSRKREQSVMIGDQIEVRVLDVRGDRVRLGFSAPADVTIHREEVYQQVNRSENTPPEEVGRGM